MAPNKKPKIVSKNKITETKKQEPVVVSAKSEVSKNPVKPKTSNSKGIGLLFDKRNYLIMIIGLLFLAVGFILMAGGGSKDPNVFNEDIFNFQRLTLAPILILMGFAIEVVAIMLKPKSQAE